MGEPFLGEIRMLSFAQAPRGYALANGQFLPINQNQALFSLFGTMYGGNGQTTFAIPDLRGRCAMHKGSSFTQGQAGGQEAHTITASEMPQHLHFLNASTLDGDTPIATSSVLGAFNNGYVAAGALAAISPSTVSNVGGSQAHLNMSPFLTISFTVCLIGLFPSQN